MVYVDTGVLVALCTHEAKTAAVLRWYSECKTELVSAAWCVTEFASALGLKQGTQQLNADQASTAWVNFERFCANDLQLLPVVAVTLHKAATLTMNPATGLRAGDALHLACAIGASARGLVTLDDVFAKNAKRLRLKVIPL